MPDPTSASTRITLVAFGTLAGLILGLLGVEAYFRLTSAPFHPDELRPISLEYGEANLARSVLPREATSLRRGTITQRVSERGYRGRPFSPEKPDSVVRVAVIGGSAVFDMEADEGKDWPALAERTLRQRGHPVEVLNLGVPGHASWDGLGRLYGEIWMFEPDYVVLYNCWNDLKYFTWLTPDSTLLRTSVVGSRPERKNPFLHPVNAVDGLLLHSRAYAWLRWHFLRRRIHAGGEGALPEDTELRDAFGPWGPRQYELTLELFVEAARQAGGDPLLMTQARLPVSSNAETAAERIGYAYVRLSHDALVRAFESCDEAARRVSRDEDVPLLDLSELNGRDSLFVDHVHLRPEGSAAVASRFSTFLERVLSES